jgi:hypothetical protein
MEATCSSETFVDFEQTTRLYIPEDSTVHNQLKGRAVAHAVSRWLPNAAAQIRVQAACGVCGGQSGTGAGFLLVLRFPLSIIPPIWLAQ